MIQPKQLSRTRFLAMGKAGRPATGQKPKKEYNKTHHDKKRSMVQAFKYKPCMDCGIQYPPYVMDFDHRDPSQKKFTIATIGRHTIAELLDEISKCDVVCSNCHRIREHDRKG